MLSQAEVQTYMNALTTVGQTYDQQIADSIGDDTTKQEAIKQAKSFSTLYQKDVSNVMLSALYEVAENSLFHYGAQLNKDLPEDLIREVLKSQYTNKYYGATLSQRLILLRLRLNRVITQTAQVGIPQLGGLFSNSIPFGAQINIPKRLLRGTAIKVEQDIAKKVAEKEDIPLIRWKLSKNHTQFCECEDLAHIVNKAVEKYLADNKMDDVDPEGLFFRDDLPDPPHPNCQCDFNLVGDKEIEPSKTGRTFGKLRRLIRKILSVKR